jgi:hypothetical protein
MIISTNFHFPSDTQYRTRRFKNPSYDRVKLTKHVISTDDATQNLDRVIFKSYVIRLPKYDTPKRNGTEFAIRHKIQSIRCLNCNHLKNEQTNKDDKRHDISSRHIEKQSSKQKRRLEYLEKFLISIKIDTRK